MATSHRGPAAGERLDRRAPQAVAGVRLDRRAPQPLAPLELDPQQRAVVEHRDGHLLVLAGPGTGKTATLAELVVARMQDPGEPLSADQVLALTFGRRAARELSDRIGARLGGGAVPVVSTFHSFAYGVLRAHSDPTAFQSAPRLLVAAQQEARLRELLTHSIEEGRLQWPESLSGAVGTRGIAEQVRALLARARALGLDGRDVARIGRRDGVPVWAALGGFFEEYLTTLEFEGSMDYAELILRAAVLANDPRAGRALRASYRLVVVDEYQDTDPAQVALLRGLAGGGAQVVAVGDPDQAIYGFRGADVRGILHFPTAFADPSGSPARVEVLRATRRFPRVLAEAASGVLRAVSLAPLPATVQRLHRSPISQDGPARVEVQTYPSAAAEAAGIAEILLRAHAGQGGPSAVGGAGVAAGDLEASAGPEVAEGVPTVPGPGLAWSQMAVIVRNPAVHGPVLARALRAAGIPVRLPPDETPLADEPAVTTLLSVVGLALDPAGAPPDAGRALLAGPVGRADAVGIRALARQLLLEHRQGSGDSPSEEPRPNPTGAGAGSATSDSLLTVAVARGRLPADTSTVPGGTLEAFRRVVACVAAARDALGEGQMVSEVLWAAWNATDWPERLRTAALRPGGYSAATSAHRDLDALVALFEMANRLPPQRGGSVGMSAFVEDVTSLRLPQEMRGVPESDRDQVRLLSAHRAKGLEWELVVVASVQEGQWPDVRLRSDLLHVDELGSGGRLAGQTHADLLAEERRLMYVACTRARSWLVVSAVAERVEGGLQASRFLPEVGPVQAMPARSARPMSAEGVIAALREAAEAPPLDPRDPDHGAVEALRAAAIDRLAALARRGRDGGPLGALAAADPMRWWGAQPLTGAIPPTARSTGDGDPLTGMDEARSRAARLIVGATDRHAPPPDRLRLSPSAVARLLDCPLRWFLERKVGAGTPSGTAATVGVIVHAVAEALARGDLPDEADIGPFIDEIWAAVPFPARYERALERQRVDDMVASLLAWQRDTGRAALASEVVFTVPVDDVEPPVTLRGAIDRVDVSADGSLHVVDFKTGKSASTARAAAENPQLGLYQLAIRRGALDGVADLPTDARVGGAELVHLGDRLASGLPKVRSQGPLDDGRTWVEDLLAEAAALAAGPDYPARVHGGCARCAFRYMCPAQAPPATAVVAPAPGQPAPPVSEPPPRADIRTTRATPPRPDRPTPRRAEPVQEPLWGGDLP